MSLNDNGRCIVNADGRVATKLKKAGEHQSVSQTFRSWRRLPNGNLLGKL
jgi:hypothetical protein